MAEQSLETSFLSGSSFFSNVVFHQMSSSTKGFLSSKVVFHKSSFFIKGCLSSNNVFHPRSTSIVVLNADDFADLVRKKGQMQATKCSIVTPKWRTAECGAVCVQAVGSSLFFGPHFLFYFHSLFIIRDGHDLKRIDIWSELSPFL